MISAYENLPNQVHFKIFEYLSFSDLISLSSISNEFFILIVPNLYNKLIYLPVNSSNIIENSFDKSLNSIQKVINLDNFDRFVETLRLNKYNEYIEELDLTYLESEKQESLSSYLDDILVNCLNLKTLKLPANYSSYIDYTNTNLSIDFNTPLVKVQKEISEIAINLGEFNELFVIENITLFKNLRKLFVSVNTSSFELVDYENLFKLLRIFSENNIHLSNLTEISVPLLGGLSHFPFLGKENENHHFDNETLVTLLFGCVDFSVLHKLELLLIEGSIDMLASEKFDDDDDDSLTQEDILFDLSSLCMDVAGEMEDANVKLDELSLKYTTIDFLEEDYIFNNNNLRSLIVKNFIETSNNSSITGLYLYLDFPNIGKDHLSLLKDLVHLENLENFYVYPTNFGNIFPSNDAMMYYRETNEENVVLEEEYEDENENDEDDSEDLFHFRIDDLVERVIKDENFLVSHHKDLKYNLNELISSEITYFSTNLKCIENYHNFHLWDYFKFPKYICSNSFLKRVNEYGFILDFFLSRKLDNLKIFGNSTLKKVSVFGLDYFHDKENVFNSMHFKKFEKLSSEYINEIKSIENSIDQIQENKKQISCPLQNNEFNFFNKRSNSICLSEESGLMSSEQRVNLFNTRRNSSYQSTDFSLSISLST